MELTRDLKESAGEPFLLFKSNEAACSSEPNICEWEGKTVARYGSDAPFLIRLNAETLYLTWSPYPKDTYIVAAAVSESNSIKGPWQHIKKPLFNKHGGHAMFFNDLDGNMKMSIHCPERPPYERALFFNVKIEDNIIKLAD